MAKFRTVKVSFWNDSKIVNEFSPEDKLFFLYLLTNPRTTQLGIYEFTPKIAAFELGFSKETIDVMLDRFENKYGLIKYSNSTGEIAIKNFLNHSIVKGGKPVLDCLKNDASNVKDKALLRYVVRNIKNKTDTLSKFIDHINEMYFYDDEYADDEKDDIHNERIVDQNRDINDLADEFFDTIWELYPKKRGKGDVKPKQRKELYRIGYDQLARCIDRYAKEVEGKDQQYIKNGGTFFNSGYVDYLDENYVPPMNSTESALRSFLGEDVVL